MLSLVFLYQSSLPVKWVIPSQIVKACYSDFILCMIDGDDMLMIATCTTWYVRVSLEYCAVALYLIHCTIELVPTLHGVCAFLWTQVCFT